MRACAVASDINRFVACDDRGGLVVWRPALVVEPAVEDDDAAARSASTSRSRPRPTTPTTSMPCGASSRNRAGPRPRTGGANARIGRKRSRGGGGGRVGDVVRGATDRGAHLLLHGLCFPLGDLRRRRRASHLSTARRAPVLAVGAKSVLLGYVAGPPSYPEPRKLVCFDTLGFYFFRFEILPTKNPPDIEGKVPNKGVSGLVLDRIDPVDSQLHG